MLYTLCIIIAQIQILHYYIVYIMYHCITDALFFISSILPYNKISRKKSVQFDADEEVQMDSFIFTLRLKLLSQPRLHHFLLVIWKLLRNRFPDFLSTQAQRLLNDYAKPFLDISTQPSLPLSTQDQTCIKSYGSLDFLSQTSCTQVFLLIKSLYVFYSCLGFCFSEDLN